MEKVGKYCTSFYRENIMRFQKRHKESLACIAYGFTPVEQSLVGVLEMGLSHIPIGLNYLNCEDIQYHW